MKKVMIFPSLAFFVISLFAFTSVEVNSFDNQVDCASALLPPCPGSITLKVITRDFQNPGNAFYAITNVTTGLVEASGAADVEDFAITLPPGTYQVSISSTGGVWVYIKYDFCGNSWDETKGINGGSINVGSQFTII